VFGGALNIIDTYLRSGTSDVTRLNDPRVAEFYVNSFMAAFGQGPVDRATALKISDAFGKYIVSSLGKYQQIQAQAPARQSSRRASGQRQSGRRWQSNADIFEGADEMLANEQTGKRRGGSEFAPKQKAGRSQFRTNSDLFDSDTLAAYNGRL
jgi:hypothetical protein